MNINRDGKAFGKFCARNGLYRHAHDSLIAEKLFEEVERLNEVLESMKTPGIVENVSIPPESQETIETVDEENVANFRRRGRPRK